MAHSRLPDSKSRKHRSPGRGKNSHRPKKPSPPTKQQSRPSTLVQQAKLDLSSLTSSDLLQLQQAYGNQKVRRLLAGSKPEQIQRQLDDAKYSPEALTAAGISAGWKFIGKTSFGKVKVALEEYFNSANPTEQYLNLNKVLAAADVYEQSSTRDKTHKAAKQAREDTKMDLVADLIVDAQAELENLKDDPDAVKAREVTFQGFESVSGRRSEVSQFVGIVQHVQFPRGDLRDPDPADTFWYRATDKEPLNRTASEALDRHSD